MTTSDRQPPATRTPPVEPEPSVLGPMLIVSAAILGLGVLYKTTGSLGVTAIAAVLAGLLGTVAQLRRVHEYRIRHWHH
jgi:hypothetical protein